MPTEIRYATKDWNGKFLMVGFCGTLEIDSTVPTHVMN
jgi:hypothetical protein